MNLKTTDTEWKDAQKYESNTWVLNNKRNSIAKIIYKFIKNPKMLWTYIKFRDFYCGDDWNYWWAEQFNWYKDLPNTIPVALEVGCGPYTNIRLIARLKSIGRIICSDPLITLYETFNHTWLSRNWNRIYTMRQGIEKISLDSASVDLVVCNNVLDHVQDAEKGMSEVYRVLRKGGYIVFGNNLLNQASEGHPIFLNEQSADSLVKDYEVVYRKVLSKEESRDGQEGTYLFIGKK